MECKIVASGSLTSLYSMLGAMDAMTYFTPTALACTSYAAVPLALVYAAQIPLKEVRSALLSARLDRLFVPHLLRLPFVGGLYSSRKFHKFLCDLTDNKKLKDCAIPLSVNAVDIATCKMHILSKDNAPDMSLATLLRISVSTPLIMEPVKWDNKYWVDGSVVDGLLLGIFLSGPQLTLVENPVGLNQVQCAQYGTVSSLPIPSKKSRSMNPTVFKMARTALQCSTRVRIEEDLRYLDEDVYAIVLKTETPKDSLLLTYADKLKLVKDGYNSAKPQLGVAYDAIAKKVR